MKKNSRGVFITGTDTGVGKTYIATMIAHCLRARGVDVGVMKPAETGCSRRSGKLVPSDAVRLAKAASVHDALNDICPYRFSKPLAPAVAAKLESKHVDHEKILRCFRTLSKHEFLIVEGAGGIMVPLTDRYSYLDLAEDLGLPVVIVARPNLGTINHTLLTIMALRERKLDIAGVVVNYSNKGKRGLAEKTSPAVIAEISGIRIAGIVENGSENIESIVDDLLSRGTKQRESRS